MPTIQHRASQHDIFTISNCLQVLPEGLVTQLMEKIPEEVKVLKSVSKLPHFQNKSKLTLTSTYWDANKHSAYILEIPKAHELHQLHQTNQIEINRRVMGTGSTHAISVPNSILTCGIAALIPRARDVITARVLAVCS